MLLKGFTSSNGTFLFCIQWSWRLMSVLVLLRLILTPPPFLIKINLLSLMALLSRQVIPIAVANFSRWLFLKAFALVNKGSKAAAQLLYSRNILLRSQKTKTKKTPDSSLKGILSMIVKIIHPWSGMAFPHNDQVKCYAAFTQGREFEELAWHYIWRLLRGCCWTYFAV